MTRKPDDWMPLHIGEYLADTTHLTRDQHGAYLLLIMAYWRRGEALPADDGQLAAISRSTPPEWRKMKAIVAAFFHERDGKWFQKRCEEELEAARKLMAAKSKAGKAGAEKRWQTDNTGNGTGMADALISQWQTDAPLPVPSEQPLPIPTELDSSVSKPSKARNQKAEHPDYPEFYKVFPRHEAPADGAKAFAAAIANGAKPAGLIDGARRYAAHVAAGREDKKFIKLPATWLNKGCWRDEYETGPTAPARAEVVLHPSWNGKQSALAAKIGDTNFDAYFAAARFEVGPPTVIEVGTASIKALIERKFGAPLRALFGTVEINVVREVSAP